MTATTQSAAAEPVAPPLPDNVDDLVAQFVRLRDKLKEADDAHKARTKAARDHLDALSGKLLERLNDLGGESVRTVSGTVYRTTRRSATIADGEVFRQFVIGNEAFDLVDWRANAAAVDDFIRLEGAMPPGVNFTTAFTVGVRRA
jgi:hypothetical protein